MVFEFETDSEVNDYVISQYFAIKLSPIKYRYSYELLSGSKNVFEQRVGEIKDRLNRLGVRYTEI